MTRKVGSRFIGVTGVAALACAGAWLLQAGPARAEDLAEVVFRDARAYTVRIRTQIVTPFLGESRGSFEGAGFLVDAERGWILTNAHVAGRSPSQIQVAFADQPFRPAEKVYVDPFADIAVIQVRAKDRGRSVALLDCDHAPEVGEPVGAFGHPLGMQFTGSRGIVSGKTDKFGSSLIQLDATVDHGNSGGPVLSLRDGHVVGIATARMGEDKNDRVNFATPIGDACRILELLRAGITPSPPQMQVALLKDEDGRLTLRAESSHDPKHWPLNQGDSIIAVAGVGDSLRCLSDLVTALRGRSGRLALVVDRGGRRRMIDVTPVPRPLLTERRGVNVDGALIAQVAFEDAMTLREPAPLIVQSVEPGSAAEMLGLGEQDIVRSVDGKRFDDVDRLIRYLAGRTGGAPITLVLRRWSSDDTRIFDYHIRQLPGEDIDVVGKGPGVP